jgi:hypothetical protein
MMYHFAYSSLSGSFLHQDVLVWDMGCRGAIDGAVYGSCNTENKQNNHNL